MSQNKAIVLGCGSSAGVPGIGNWWGNCDPDNPKNKRSRASIALISNEKTVLIDAGPDITLQVNRENLSVPDAIICTHAHGDHINGMDDVRWWVRDKKEYTPVYSNNFSIKEIQSRFGHLFEPKRPDLYKKIFEPVAWNNDDYYKTHTVEGFEFSLIPLDHESIIACGFRFNDFAYTTDVARFGDKELNALKGVKTWMVDAAGYMNEDNVAHCSIPLIIKYNEIVQAEQVYFTSMPPSMDYETVLNETPTGYAPAYDGLIIEF